MSSEALGATAPPLGALPPSTRAPWGWREAGLGVVLALALFFVIGAAVVYPLEARFGKDSVGALFGQAGAVILLDGGLVAIVYLLVSKRGGTWRQVGLRRPDLPAPSWYASVRRALSVLVGFSPPWLVWVALSSLVASFFVIEAYAVVVTVADIDVLKPSPQVEQPFFDHRQVLALLAVAVVLTAPFAEEVFFRGFVFGGLRGVFGLWPAAFVSGFVFSLAHTDVGLMIPFTLVGVILAYTYEKTGSLVTPISIHLLFNLTSFLILAFVPGARG